MLLISHTLSYKNYKIHIKFVKMGEFKHEVRLNRPEVVGDLTFQDHTTIPGRFNFDFSNFRAKTVN